MSNPDRQRFLTSDLVLQVSPHVDYARWDEDKYDAFLTELCSNRDYQREAILTALRYLLVGNMPTYAHWHTRTSTTAMLCASALVHWKEC